MNRTYAAILASAAIGFLGCGDSGTTSADGGTSSGDVTTAHGDFHKYVMNSLKVPASASMYAMDLNGDGRSDNQLGRIISALMSQNLDTQGAIDTAVMGGKVILLLSVQTMDAALKTDDQVGVTAYLGQSMMNPDFGGMGMFTVDNTQAPAKFYGKLSSGHFSSNNPVTTKNPVTIQLALPLVAGAPALQLPVNGAHLQFDASTSGLMNGQLNGSIKSSDLQNTVIPALANLLNSRIKADPGCPANCSQQNRQILQLFDVGDGNGGNCMNPDGSPGKPNDGIISPCEVSGNSFLQSILAPDVQIFDASGNYAPNPANTKKDSLSLGLGFTAVGAQFTTM